jgi:hypothetical protein
LPYGGPAGSKNISWRINVYPFLMGATKEAEREATWESFRWMMKSENGGRFPRSSGHVVSPLRSRQRAGAHAPPLTSSPSATLSAVSATIPRVDPSRRQSALSTAPVHHS